MIYMKIWMNKKRFQRTKKINEYFSKEHEKIKIKIENLKKERNQIKEIEINQIKESEKKQKEEIDSLKIIIKEDFAKEIEEFNSSINKMQIQEYKTSIEIMNLEQQISELSNDIHSLEESALISNL